MGHCYKCKRHTATCHINCPFYFEEQEESKERRAAGKKESEANEARRSPAYERRERDALNKLK